MDDGAEGAGRTLCMCRGCECGWKRRKGFLKLESSISCCWVVDYPLNMRSSSSLYGLTFAVEEEVKDRIWDLNELGKWTKKWQMEEQGLAFWKVKPG